MNPSSRQCCLCSVSSHCFENDLLQNGCGDDDYIKFNLLYISFRNIINRIMEIIFGWQNGLFSLCQTLWGTSYESRSLNINIKEFPFQKVLSFNHPLLLLKRFVFLSLWFEICASVCWQGLVSYDCGFLGTNIHCIASDQVYRNRLISKWKIIEQKVDWTL